MKCHILCTLIAGIWCSSLALSQPATVESTPPEGHRSKWGWDYRVPLPKEGLVPDKETAIQIAEVVLFRLYGKEDIIAERPYKVKEEDYVWWISGTLKSNGFGSAFNIAISKQTAAVLHLEH